MCNCNNKRNSLSTQMNHSQIGMVKVKLIQNTSFVFHGNITGRMYVFQNLGDLLWIDKKDAINLSNSKVLQVIY